MIHMEEPSSMAVTDDAAAWVAEAVLSVIELYVEYRRRILDDTQSLPYLWLWLVKSPPDEYCECRQR